MPMPYSIQKQKIFELQKEFSEYEVVPVSAKENKNLDLLKEAIWGLSGFIKVYSKGDLSKPVALQKGASVKDVAQKIHKEFVEKFRYAKITGPSTKFAEQKVGLNHELQDNAIVEIVINATYRFQKFPLCLPEKKTQEKSQLSCVPIQCLS